MGQDAISQPICFPSSEQQKNTQTVMHMKKSVEVSTEKLISHFSVFKTTGFSKLSLAGLCCKTEGDNNETFKSLEILKNYTTIEELDLSKNNIEDSQELEILAKIRNLFSLNLSENKLSNTNFLNFSNEIHNLNVSNNILSTINLPSLKNLIFLNLEGNSINNADFLKDLPNLVELNLSKNTITSFPKNDISCKNTLTKLNVRSNMFSSVASLAQFLNLEYLDISQNQLVTMEEFSASQDCFKKLDYLNVAWNLISFQPKTARFFFFFLFCLLTFQNLTFSLFFTKNRMNRIQNDEVDLFVEELQYLKNLKLLRKIIFCDKSAKTEYINVVEKRDTPNEQTQEQQPQQHIIPEKPQIKKTQVNSLKAGLAATSSFAGSFRKIKPPSPSPASSKSNSPLSAAAARIEEEGEVQFNLSKTYLFCVVDSLPQLTEIDGTQISAEDKVNGAVFFGRDLKQKDLIKEKFFLKEDSCSESESESEGEIDSSEEEEVAEQKVQMQVAQQQKLQMQKTGEKQK